MKPLKSIAGLLSNFGKNRRAREARMTQRTLDIISKLDAKAQVISDYSEMTAMYMRDFLHYFGNDIASSSLGMSEANGRLISVVGEYYPYQYSVDLKKLAANAALPGNGDSIPGISTDIGAGALRVNKIERLTSLPSVYWLSFCVHLLETGSREESLRLVADEYKRHLSNENIAKNLPKYTLYGEDEKYGGKG